MKNSALIYLAATALALTAAAQVTDTRDGQTYRTVRIGSDIWMAQNLNFKTDNSRCYDNKESNCAKYGRLYNFEDATKACPAGWHLPENDEWRELISYAEPEKTAGTKLKAKSGWNTDKNYKQGTDNFGFSALPGGGHYGASFGYIGDGGSWWSSDNRIGIYYFRKDVVWHSSNETYLFSVRCIANPTIITDTRDGQTYRTVKIGNQTWMTKNINFKTDNSKCYDNRESNCERYGKLYNWKEAKKACPVGWHLPSKDELEALIAYAGGEITAGAKLKAKSNWNTEDSYMQSTDEFGFSAMPSGNGNSDGSFSNAGDFGYLWSSTEIDSTLAYSRSMGHYFNAVVRLNLYKTYLYSVRCLKDETHR